MSERHLASSAAAWPASEGHFATEPRKVIGKVAAAICARRFRPLPRAVILTGSLARGEGSFLKVGKERRALGDAEFALVFPDAKQLPSPKAVAAAEEEIERELKAQSIVCPVGLSPVPPEYLSSLKPHIYAYELRVCGNVVWGDREILNLIPQFEPEDIPLEDAWRLLCNRLIELLDGIGATNVVKVSAPLNLKYRVCKLYLDMATSYLLFMGAYAPTYAERSRRLLMSVSQSAQATHRPTDLLPFASEVAAWTHWKLAPRAEDGPDPRESLGMAVVYARILWRRELARLTGLGDELMDDGLTDDELMQAWMRRQPILTRLRGWASVARRLGLRQSCHESARWAGLAVKGSPRYWLYAAACPLIFRLPFLLASSGASSSDRQCAKALEWLPLRQARPGTGPNFWRPLAQGIVSNYHQFLVETRS